MTITREQVADLQPGDVVEVTNDKYPDVTMRGPLRPDAESPRRLFLGATVIRCDDGSPLYPSWTLTVVSPAPRPLYVNHPRSEPVPGDVVRDADSDKPQTWTRNSEGFSYEWLSSRSHNYEPREKLPARLRLLVDGETGQVVQ